jgi:hypothetical protein
MQCKAKLSTGKQCGERIWVCNNPECKVRGCGNEKCKNQQYDKVLGICLSCNKAKMTRTT